MVHKKLLFGIIGVLILGVLAVWYGLLRDPGYAYIDPADEELVVRGQTIYVNSCAACHGDALQGQANWRKRQLNGRLPAPPHDKTGHTWHHPDEMLFDMVKNGLVPGRTAPRGYQSDMPAYSDVLNDEDIVAVIAYIKSHWPAKVLAAQKEVTMQRQKQK